MHVNVCDGLSGGVPDVYPDIVARGGESCLEIVTKSMNETPNGTLFRGRQFEEIGLMSPWEHKCVTRTQRVGIGNRHRQRVFQNQLMALNLLAERAAHWWFHASVFPAHEGAARRWGN